jgi:hypothetical protein
VTGHHGNCGRGQIRLRKQQTHREGPSPRRAIVAKPQVKSTRSSRRRRPHAPGRYTTADGQGVNSGAFPGARALWHALQVSTTC